MWHAESVQSWVVVMVVILVAGLALTVFGALSDRAKNRRRAEAMLAPPQRTIPNLPADAPSPSYVTQAQARRRPGGTTPVAIAERHPDDAAAIEVPVGYASVDFVTDPGRREAVLDEPSVLVCDGPVEAIRELLPALEHALRTGDPLVVLASAFAPEVLGTLEVNALQNKVRLLAITADDTIRTTVAASSGVTPVDATDRHSGWLDPAALGHLARWTSTARTSRLLVVAAKAKHA